MPNLAENLFKLNRALNRLTGAEDLPDLSERILDVVEEVFGRDTAALLLIQPDGKSLRITAARGYDPVVLASYQGEVGIGIAGSAALGEPRLVEDVACEPGYIHAVAGALSEMAVPLRVDGRVIGVLDVESRMEALDQEDMALFTAFGEHAAWAIRHLQAQGRALETARRLRLIAQAGHVLNSRHDPDECLDGILRAGLEALGLGRVCLLLVDPDNQDLVVHSAVGYGDVIGQRIAPGKGITGRVGVTGRAEWVRDVRTQADYLQGVVGGVTEMAVPLRVFGELIGVLDTESTRSEDFCDEDLELFAAFADQVAVALHNARLIKGLEEANSRMVANVEEMGRLNRQLESHSGAIQEANANLGIQIRQLKALHDAGQAITSSLDLNTTLEVILRTTAGIVNSSTSAIKLLDDETKELKVQAQNGVILDPNAPFHALSLPLRIGEKTIGVFELIRTASEEMNASERQMLETLASQASIAIENARLFEDTQRTYYDTLRALAKVMEARDDYTRGHSERVAELSLATAHAMKLPEEDCNIIFNAALLHDIGKIGVRDAVLLSESPLSAGDMDIIRRHPTYSNTILGPLKFLGKVSEYVKHHHEAWDGSGYPQGLKGEQIPFISRIITVADAYDAMTSTRPYRQAKSHETAMGELRAMSGRQFDPKIVEVFLKVMAVGRPEPELA